MTARAGYAYIELIVTLALTAIVATALSSALVAHLRVARIITARVATADALRLTTQVLPAELRFADPAADLHGIGRDSVALRLPRLSGSVCAHADGHLWLRARGLREPDARKDSLLLRTTAGERVGAIVTVTETPGACPVIAGETVYRLDTAPVLASGGLALLFESGTYYLRDRALRYRLGGEGRQPVTDEVLVDAGSGVTLRADSTRASFTIRLAFNPAFGRETLAPVTTVFQLPNAWPGR